MDLLLIGLIIVGVIVFIIKQLNKVTENTPIDEDKSEYKRKTLPPIEDPNKNIGYGGLYRNVREKEEIKFDFNLDIKSIKDVKEAEKLLQKIEIEHLNNIDDKSNDKFYKAIDKIHNAIGNYYDKKEPFRDYEEYFLDAILVDIEYEKQNGEIINRSMNIKKYEKTDFDDITYIHGYCYDIKQNRVFRVQNIRKFILVETKEEIKNIDSFLLEEYKKTSYYKLICKLDSIIDKYKEIFRILLYVARANGSCSINDKSIVRETIIKITNDDTITADNIDIMINRLDMPVSFDEFKIDVKSISKQNLQIDIFKIALDMINNQNKIGLIEREALEYMAENLDNVSKDDIIYKADVLEQQKNKKL